MDVRAVARVARDVAEDAAGRVAWNYDAIEVEALYAVANAFDRFASLLDRAADEEEAK